MGHNATNGAISIKLIDLRTLKELTLYFLDVIDIIHDSSYQHTHHCTHRKDSSFLTSANEKEAEGQQQRQKEKLVCESCTMYLLDIQERKMIFYDGRSAMYLL